MQGIVQSVVRRSGTLRGRRDRKRDQAGIGEHDTSSMMTEKGVLEEEDMDKKSFISEKESML